MNKSYEKIIIRNDNDIDDELSPKTQAGWNAIHNSLYDDCNDTFYVDEYGQIFVPSINGMMFVAKARI